MTTIARIDIIASIAIIPHRPPCLERAASSSAAFVFAGETTCLTLLV